MNSTALNRFRGPVWILALLVMVLGLLAPSATVSAVGATPGISGRVVNSDGLAVAGVTVSVVQRVSDGDGVRYVPVSGVSATTGTTGDYLINVPAGTYRVLTAATSVYAPTFYPNVSYADQATDVVVSTDTVSDGRTISVNRPGAITGTVQRALDGAPVAGATATLERLRTTPSPSTWVAVGLTATTNALGGFQIDHVSPASSYRVRVSGAGFASQVTPNGSIAVASSQTSSVPTVLLFPDDSGVVRGQVTNAADQPVINVQVRARQQVVTPEGTTWAVVGDPVATGVDGSYALALPAGTYRLQFSGPQLQTQFYPDSDTVQTGGDIPVQDGQFSSGYDVTVTQIGGGGSVIANLEPPAVIGNAGGGQVLTADPGTWTAATSKSYFYHWLQCTSADVFDCNDAAGANNAATYTIPKNSSIKDLRYRVQVQPFNANTVTSAPTSPTPGPTGILILSYPTTKFENRGRPVLSGNALPGQTLTTTTGKWSSVPTSVTLQWYADASPIPGATSTTYTVLPTNVGTRLSVVATATFSGSTATGTSATTSIIGLNTIQHLVSPRIAGVARAGDTLTADPGSWSEDGLTYGYLWFADDLAIPGATNATFVPTVSQIGKRIRVLVQVSKTGFAPAAALSAQTMPVVQAGSGPDGQVLSNVTPPSITGTPNVAGTLTAVPGTWSVEPDSYKYQWRKNGVAITGATSKTLVVTDDLFGTQVSVVVTAVKADYPEKSAESTGVPIAAGTVTNLVRPAVTGAAGVGQKLTATSGTWDTAGLDFSYQWRSNGTAIGGANGPTLTLPGATAGSLVTVDVTATRKGYAPATATSQAVGPVSSGTITVSSNPAVVGTPRYGSLLLAVLGSVSPASAVSVHYQWLRNGVPIPGAAKSSYKPVAADLAKRLAVRVTYTAPGYGTVVRTSASTAVIKTLPKLGITRKHGASKSTFRITVNAPGAKPATGVVELRSGGKVVARGRLASGRVVLTVANSRHLKKVNVVYRGEARVLPRTATGVKVP